MRRRGPVDVGRLEDFTDGVVRRVDVEGHSVGLLRWHGALYAFADRCPHMGAPMCHGRLAARLEAQRPGELATQCEEPVLACPWHGWEFLPATGRALADDRSRLRTYEVHVEAGRVLVNLERHGTPSGDRR